ncbi:MAG: beta strand repeat-containing protein [Flavobacterium sp.]|uniref:beta strand repeat-containing protein n=1 Tax=Flavobacterium sp. TaxID=239 RepID=UPI0037AB7C9F
MNKNIQKLALGSIFALACTLNLNAQVVSQKVGDNPTMISPSAVLDIESLNKGVLVPRMALTGATDVTTVVSPATSLLVYNTATAGIAPNDVTPGFYYWNGTAWTRLATGASATDSQTLSLAGSVLSISGGNSITLPADADAIVGNEVTDVNAGKGLTRTGTGTAADPYKVGMTDGTAAGQVMEWNGTAWTIVNGASVVPNATTLVLGKVQLAGDLAGSGTVATAPKVSGLQGHPVSATAPTTGQILAFNGTSWVPTAPSAASEMDGVIGNEITDVVANKGLSRTGTGTDVDPYKVGMTDGTAAGQVMKWNGTAWAPAADAGLTTEVDGSVTNEIQTLSIAGSTVSLSNGGGSVVLPAETDGVIGNEVTDVTANMGLTRSGSGTAVAPYTVGMTPGTAAGQVMQWNGTNWGLSSAGTGTVTSVIGTAPISVATGTSTPVISLNNLGVTNAHLAADAVTTDKILDGTVANADLGNGVGGIYKGSGSLAGATTVTGGANTLAFTSNATNGFSVDGATFSVDAANNRVGIGTSTPTGAPLHVSSATAGAIKITDGTQSVGKVLVSDANGVGSWGKIPLTAAQYENVNNAASGYPITNDEQLIFSNEVVDTDNGYDPTTNIYTIPADGLYAIYGYMRLGGKHSTSPVNPTVTSVQYRVNGVVKGYLCSDPDPAATETVFQTFNETIYVFLNQGDQLDFKYYLLPLNAIAIGGNNAFDQKIVITLIGSL